MKFAAIILLMFSLSSHAKDVECERIPEFQIKMDAHASNYQNAETTRTPEGGADKIKKVVCQKDCKIIESESFIQKYLPNHPDANKNGYVFYPYIDKEIEPMSVRITKFLQLNETVLISVIPIKRSSLLNLLVSNR
jgi:flagellar basal body rod protein FlgC